MQIPSLFEFELGMNADGEGGRLLIARAVFEFELNPVGLGMDLLSVCLHGLEPGRDHLCCSLAFNLKPGGVDGDLLNVEFGFELELDRGGTGGDHLNV